MRVIEYAALLASALASPSMAQEGAVADVVVTARAGSPPPLLDAIGYYRRHCVDPTRRMGRPLAPVDDPDWRALGETDRRRFRVADPQAPAYGLADPVRGHTLLLKIERPPVGRGWRVTEERCTLVVIGGRDHRGLVDGFAAIFGGPGTQRHVGAQGGQPALPG